ncbi:glycoside hydrolase family 3 protein [Piromyces sp. E2]|nr:glycoside hydrolase family 3 protein [Piromyces sp. E2]|eukprot:OUM59053.1 glycoside hydrolase family 3 protein [Piromyces sp. E2]
MKFSNILLLFAVNSYLVYSLPAKTDSSLEDLSEIENAIEVDADSANGVEIIPSEDEDTANEIVASEGECTVLLRKNGDFPLAKNEKKIHLYGSGIRRTIKGGLGSGDISIRSFDNIETAFTKSGFEILTKDYLDAFDTCYEKAHDKYIKSIQDQFDYENAYGFIVSHFSVIMKEPECENLPVQKEGDVAIFVVSRASGEGVDRTVEKGDVLLTDTERNTIKTLARGYKKFMLVLNTGGPVDLSGLDEVKNILVLSQLGGNTSKALVDLITDEKYPSGKLATTWTKYDDYFANVGNDTDTDYVEGIYVGYRYFDSADVDVMFPFGYGLGYTDFKINSNKVKLNKDKVTVDASVKNIGKFDGKEVLELYLSKPSTTLDEPYQVLVNFAKTKELAPGQKDNVKLEFKLTDFASYDTKSQSYILDAGSYIVRLGNSSRNTTPVAVIEVPSRVTVKKVQNQIGESGFKDLSFKSTKKDDLRGVKTFKLNVKSIKTETVDYQKTYEINKDLKALSTEEKVKFVIGAHSSEPYADYLYTVPGTAGETYKYGDLKPVVLSDGPAGLNIAKDYYIDEAGKHSLKPAFAESTLEIVPEDAKPSVGFLFPPQAPEGSKIYHQYTTAIPIGTALAQTWNIEFAEQVGNIVGDEMNIFGSNLWLAPALNIHRTILNGRNFEYYSEDPYISGMMASYHYTANNKETNRSFNSSNMSERAFREIYLRGFEITIKNANPKAIMTSYNLINGVHVNQHVGVINNVLRKENHYNNIIMTDWVFTNMGVPGSKYPEYSPYEIIKASVDVIMPGNKDFYDMVLAAVKENKLTMEELEASASRIYELIQEVQN